MGRILAIWTIALTCGLSALALGQQGRMGGLSSEDSVRTLENALSRYLYGDEIKNILSPGEFSEWTLKLTAGQVVIAEARSDAFDPALEIVDSDNKDKVLASNDDRYPGDQRPLLLWRCERNGTYAIHARCFHDKSGGQFFLRFKTYDSVDLSSGQMVEKDVDSRTEFLLRVPMKAGQMKTFISDADGPHKYMGFRTEAVISPSGLPDIDLTRQISPVTGSFMAPADGDYYVIAVPFGNGGIGKVHAGSRDIVAKGLVKQGSAYSAEAPTNTATLWELPVKAGEFLEVSMPQLDLNPRFVLAEVPDITKFNVSKAETNPFYPLPKGKAPVNNGPAFDIFPGRARDGRIVVFYARRNTKLWLATDGRGRPNSQFTLNVREAAADYAVEKTNAGQLRVGSYDYWSFEAQAGDVMTLNTAAEGFSEQIIVRDPDLNEIRHTTAGPDQTSDGWKMIVQRPGRYLVAVSCMGDGGAGQYSLTRKVLHAKEFGKGSPAQAEISDGQIQVWKFTAMPKTPLLIRWRTNGSYDVAIYDEKGVRTDFERQMVDDHNMFGILKVAKPQTFVIVLTGSPGRANYSIELNDLPGYGT